MKVSFLSHEFSPALLFLNFFNVNFCSWGEITAQYQFDFHFPYGEWWYIFLVCLLLHFWGSIFSAPFLKFFHTAVFCRCCWSLRMLYLSWILVLCKFSVWYFIYLAILINVNEEVYLKYFPHFFLVKIQHRLSLIKIII